MESESRIVVGEKRRLVIDARPETVGELEVSRSLLGLSLLERMVRAALRAGIAEIIVVVPRADHIWLYAGLGLLPLSAFHHSLPARPCGIPTILAPGDTLGEVAWLAALMRLPIAADEEQGRDGIWLLGPNASAAAARCVSHRHTLALEVQPLRLRRAADHALAERRLLQGLRKPTDGTLARILARPLSIALSRRLVALGVTPNQMTIVSMAVGLASAPFFLSADPAWQVTGGLLLVAHSILDGCDGELARLTFRESRLGGLLDFVGDNVVHVAVFACMAIGLCLAAGAAWPLLFGFGAIVGTIGSASAVYWLTLRRKADVGPLYTSTTAGGSALSKLLDELSRRDFIYLVPVFGAFGQAQWFAALSGIGAPVFLSALLAAAAFERRRRPFAGRSQSREEDGKSGRATENKILLLI